MILTMKFYSKSLTLFSLLSFCFTGNLHAEELEIWISSFQDQVYYEQMGELYAKKKKKEFSINVKAYGFREMPDKEMGGVSRSCQHRQPQNSLCPCVLDT